MERLYLKLPLLEDKKNVIEFKQEFLGSGQEMAGVSELEQMDCYEDWLTKIRNEMNKETCVEGRVPATLYLTYRLSDNKLIGIVQVRHELNDYLLKYGGHIGDCVRPSEQGNGYATEQIGLALQKCEEFGIKRVLITCLKNNIASARTIQKNAGKLEDEVMENGQEKQRYWIDLV